MPPANPEALPPSLVPSEQTQKVHKALPVAAIITSVFSIVFIAFFPLAIIFEPHKLLQGRKQGGTAKKLGTATLLVTLLCLIASVTLIHYYSHHRKNVIPNPSTAAITNYGDLPWLKLLNQKLQSPNTLEPCIPMT